MKVKKVFYTIKKGYYRPTLLPLWKLIIVYLIWIASIGFYISSIVYSLWFVVLAMIFQTIAMLIPSKWDTESWKETEQGKRYIEKYEQDEY